MALTNEDLLALSQLLDTKLKEEIQPLKEEIRDVKSHLGTEIQNVRNELKEEIQDVRNELKEEIQDVRNELKTEMQDVKSHLETEVQDIRLHLENITDKNIQLLAENYLPAAKRYEKETEKFEAIQQDVDILKKVVAEHSEKLQKIS